MNMEGEMPVLPCGRQFGSPLSIGIKGVDRARPVGFETDGSIGFCTENRRIAPPWRTVEERITLFVPDNPGVFEAPRNREENISGRSSRETRTAAPKSPGNGRARRRRSPTSIVLPPK